MTSGRGNTVMVKVIGVPGQTPPVVDNTGVTVMVATCVVGLVFCVTNAAILPVPLAARPILGLLFVQLKEVPGKEPVKVTAAVNSPLHVVWLPTGLTVGSGFTVMVKIRGMPGQLTPPFV